MATDKMRAEFEAWAKAAAYDLSQTVDDKYWWAATSEAWQVWQAAYAAGRKAERETMQKQALQQLVDEAQKLDMGY